MAMERSRAERFCSKEPLRLVTAPTNHTFGDSQKWGSKFIIKWIDRNEEIALKSMPPRWTAVVDQAIKGILHEGMLDETRRSVCKKLANELESVKKKSQEEILKRVVYIYTEETFWYRLINASLRNEDWSKIDTVGPFCFLLQNYLLNSMMMQGFAVEERPSEIAYRAMSLSNEDIENYKSAIGKQITWLAFTSTSKSRSMAKEWKEVYKCNTFVTLQFKQRWLWNFSSDIMEISCNKKEEEILLMAGYIFTLDKFEPGAQNGHWEMQLSEGYT